MRPARRSDLLQTPVVEGAASTFNDVRLNANEGDVDDNINNDNDVFYQKSVENSKFDELDDLVSVDNKQIQLRQLLSFFLSLTQPLILNLKDPISQSCN